MTETFNQALKDRDQQFLAQICENIRIEISLTNNPPIEILAKSKIVPDIISFLDPTYFEYEKLVEECSWILANIASGPSDYVKSLIGLGAIDIALGLFECKSQKVQENALWILSNIAGEHTDYRDELLMQDVVSKSINLVAGKNVEVYLVETLSWLTANLCRKPYPDYA
mmetsp:Transcript_13311/g.11394  ORF Transcript_13311/g.11394 Transcript_13311/m.11394 type:complete len:169 (-) Transcript_13311:489-995(-)|eukprot:CAMPEP_0114580622 /NCGR_PEP_ID=MMETSP0125-20121206/4867_1 /TAXON_ID=485358 ORGANISM="Aristerostoma sp., Strain ATCC 50986" /NCGR_SAMPLE_ID=MMETSP0125 /ASSEMBLY_ACC=CAM_ASM_000245 /LENGTH=168 /DNA_ID=CAMNT_0001772287 /DNA_START=146 /DNA_END=652 /DNA_ORIENTATION=-